MSVADNSRFVIRDRNWHPKALTPDYKTSILRSPRQALVSIHLRSLRAGFLAPEIWSARQRPVAQFQQRRAANR